MTTCSAPVTTPDIIMCDSLIGLEKNIVPLRAIALLTDSFVANVTKAALEKE
ncbi:unnamed protein product [Brassica rapa subsp. trilocularis]